MIKAILASIAATVLLGACESASAPREASEVKALDGNPVLTLTPLPAEAAGLGATADRLQAEYATGRREFPQMSADPRNSVTPEMLKTMMETADRLADAHDARNAD